jgi:two-component system nitrate/nitrite response regulator NarL
MGSLHRGHPQRHGRHRHEAGPGLESLTATEPAFLRFFLGNFRLNSEIFLSSCFTSRTELGFIPISHKESAVKTAAMNGKLSARKERIKILVADDHPVVRKGLQSCLAKQDRLKLVGEASDGDEAVKKIRELSPDVVLMDISMPRMNGLAVTELIRKEAPKVKVLVLSVHNNRDYIFRIIQAGAHGFVSKEASPDELLRAIESVYQGDAFFSPEIAQAALNQIVTSGGKKEPFAQLTSREREVLVLIAEGQSNKEIATKLGIGVRTIETHRERIMRRLDIHSVAGLTKFAIANGMISIEERAGN